jgi:hypothetical protein
MKTKLPPGHGWAYLGVILGLGASVAGNVSNTVLTPSDVHLGLRIPFAVLWPIFLGIGIEVLTRIEWERNWRTWVARALLVGPVSALSAFMSYLHLHHLMILSGEPGLAQAVGPVAIDGTLFGCTVALMVTRGRARHGAVTQRQTLVDRVAAMRTTLADLKDAATKDPAPALKVVPDPFPVPVSPAVEVQRPVTSVPLVPGPLGTALSPVVPAWRVSDREDWSSAPVSPARVPVRRSPVGSWDMKEAVRLVLEGVRSNQDIADQVGTGAKTVQRMRRAAVLLVSDPGAVVPAAWKVSPDVVDLIRTEVSR